MASALLIMYSYTEIRVGHCYIVHTVEPRFSVTYVVGSNHKGALAQPQIIVKKLVMCTLLSKSLLNSPVSDNNNQTTHTWGLCKVKKIPKIRK